MRRAEGFVLAVALTVVAILTVMVMVALSVSLRARVTNATEGRKTQAFYAAQSGLERLLARTRQLQGAPLPDSAASPAGAAAWLAAQLGNWSEGVPGGRFEATATASAAPGAGRAAVTLLSQGYSTRDGSTRRLWSAVPVRVNANLPDQLGALVGSAPAGLTLSGAGRVRAFSPLAGAPPVGHANPSPVTLQCPPAYRAADTCLKASTDPDRYRLSLLAGSEAGPAPGTVLRPDDLPGGPPGGSGSQERYVVERVEGGMVELTVLSDAVAAGSRPGEGASSRTFGSTTPVTMHALGGVPAVMTPAGAAPASGPACPPEVTAVGGCAQHTMSPDTLFTAVMGGGKDEIRAKFQRANAGFPGTYSAAGRAPCPPDGPPVQWLRLGQPTAQLLGCTAPQLVVVDGRGLDPSAALLELNLPPQQVFRGLLYVLTRPGVAVRLSPGAGLAGAALIDNGDGDVDFSGLGGPGEDCRAAQGALRQAPRLCHDAELLGTVRNQYVGTILTQRVLEVDLQAAQWREVAQFGEAAPTGGPP